MKILKKAKVKRTPKKRKFTPEFIKKLTKNLGKWIKRKDSLWLGSFAADNKIHRQRMSEIAERDEDFKEIYELAKQIQENKIFLGALVNKLNPTMAIFTLKNVAGWRDRKEVESEASKELKEAIEKIGRIMP
ncbi:MAG: terminase small subunit [Enterobacteriaceae bacterium]|nr:terminase small subunit [Enterobacteriaceae bacterium]